MIYSNACAYAIRAISRLAMLRPDGYVLLEELCDGTDLPRHFVAKIFQELVRKGLLTSAKGRGGGFALARKPDQISLFDIVHVIDGTEQLDNCVVGMTRCDDSQSCPQHDHWRAIRTQLRTYLMETTLEAMSKALEQKLQKRGEPRPTLSGKSKPLRPR